jgi:hypothetical protein
MPQTHKHAHTHTHAHTLSAPPQEPRAQVLGSLLFMDAHDLAREWALPHVSLVAAGLGGQYPALQVGPPPPTHTHTNLKP